METKIFAVCRIDNMGKIAIKNCINIRECEWFYESFGKRFYENNEIKHKELNGIHYYNLYVKTSQ
jgi:hypothetical protein